MNSSTFRNSSVRSAVFCVLAIASLRAQQPKSSAVPAIAPAATPAVTSTAVTTPGGTAGLMPVWTGASTIGNSIVYQTANGIGIGRFPNATLDIGGTSTFRGSMGVSRAGEATTSAGANSFPILMQSSVYHTTLGKNVLPYFQIMTEPAANNTANPGATLNFMYYSGVGAAPVESGLYFNGNGVIHFAPSQTFPITQGPAGPAGPEGPAGPSGPTGPAGPAGPAIALPYSASAAGTGHSLFTITDTSSAGGAAITGNGANSVNQASYIGGAGLVGQGGSSATSAGLISFGGNGLRTTGGPAVNNKSYGGSGLYSVGGSAVTGSGGGDGLDAYGGNATDANRGGYGIYAAAGSNGLYAGFFVGNVGITGNLSKAGGSFKIDDPIDPANKYLSHSFVESPDMMNVYNGNVVTDGSGTALVTMPDYFEALNRDFRYQLTVIGQFAQAIVGSEMSNGSFVIRTDKPGVKVSWQVTGIRQDAWANAHRIPNEELKTETERGHFLHPELFGHAEEASAVEMEHSLQKSRSEP